MKFSTWLEVKKSRIVPKKTRNDFTGFPGPECEKCGEKMRWVPEPKFKTAWWGSKPGDRGPKWLNKGHWQCSKCRINRVPELDAAAIQKLKARRQELRKNNGLAGK